MNAGVGVNVDEAIKVAVNAGLTVKVGVLTDKAGLFEELIRNQAHDGHWENGDGHGPVYTTTLCALMLEVYYRYLPTYKKVEAIAEVKATSDDDVTVEVK